MSFLVSAFERRSTSAHPRDPVLADMFGVGAQNSAGVQVTPDSAMRSAAIYACVRVLAETVAALPLQMFERVGDGEKRRADTHPWYRPMHRQPNGWQSSSEFRELMMTWLAVRGAAYARVEMRMGRRWLRPLHPDRVMPMLRDDGTLTYEYFSDAGRREVLLQDEVLRIPYLMRDNGVDPVSPIRLHAESVAQSLATKQYTNNFLRAGGRPPGYIKMETPFGNADARKNFKELLQEQIKKRETLLLEAGTYEPIGITNEDAQLAELTNMSLLDCARIYRMPPHMIGDWGRATWNNAEQAALGFVVYTMGPWLVRWEQALSRDLLTEAEQEIYFFEFNVAGLLRGDAKTRADLYLKGRQGGWYSINDIRDLENLNRIENGDDYLQPLNMAPVGTQGDPDADRTPSSSS